MEGLGEQVAQRRPHAGQVSEAGLVDEHLDKLGVARLVLLGELPLSARNGGLNLTQERPPIGAFFPRLPKEVGGDLAKRVGEHPSKELCHLQTPLRQVERGSQGSGEATRRAARPPGSRLAARDQKRGRAINVPSSRLVGRKARIGRRGKL